MAEINLGFECEMFCRNCATVIIPTSIRAVTLLALFNKLKVANIPCHKYILYLFLFLL